MKKPRLLGLAAVGVAAGGVVAAVGVGAWLLVQEDEPEARGACGPIPYQLSVEPDDGALEVSFELVSTAPGEVWDVVVRQGDTVLLDGQRTTDEDAELDVDVPARESGDDEFAVLATSERGAECTARITRG